MKTTAVRQPVNINDIRDDLKHLYIDSYEYKDQEIKEYSNCFVTYNGIVLSNLQYVNECFYSPKSYKKKYYKWAVKKYLSSKFSKWGKANTVNLLKDKTYVIIHQPYINYFHWTIESLMRLMVFEAAYIDAKLIIPADLKEVLYVKNSLDILGVNYQTTEGSKDCAVKKLALPAMVWWGNRYNPAMARLLAHRFQTAILLKQIRPGSNKRVFIIRETGRRKIVNAIEVKAALEKMDFYVVDFDGKTQQEQIAVLAGAKLVVGQHGAALTNILFMRQNDGCTVVEIYVDPAENNYVFDDSYYILASALGHTYYSFIAQKANKDADFYNSDHLINVESLIRLINSIA